MLVWPYVLKIKVNGTVIFDKNNIENKPPINKIRKISCNKTCYNREILTKEVFRNAR